MDDNLDDLLNDLITEEKSSQPQPGTATVEEDNLDNLLGNTSFLPSLPSSFLSAFCFGFFCSSLFHFGRAMFLLRSCARELSLPSILRLSSLFSPFFFCSFFFSRFELILSLRRQLDGGDGSAGTGASGTRYWSASGQRWTGQEGRYKHGTRHDEDGH